MRPERRSGGFFTSREMMRLSSAIVLLGIVGLLYVQAKQTSAWRTIAPEVIPSAPPSAPWEERVVPHPGHTDAEEIDALKEELQAIGDLTPMAAEEMPAYWRLVKWAYAVPGAELRKQARTDLLFTHLFQAPDKNRGALVDVKLHVRRILQHEAPKNSAEVTRVYEAWGPSEDSQTFPYCVVFVDLPPGMKVEANAYLDARFVGFFLKKLYYQDATGARRSAPLLIGRVVYDEAIANQVRTTSARESGLSVPWIVGIVLVLVTLVGLTQLWGRTSPATPRSTLTDEASVDAFLGELESGSTQTPPPDPPPD